MNLRLPIRTRSIRFQLLVAVNVPLAVLVTLFLVHDFRRGMSERLVDKQIALDEEAKAILPAVLQIRHHDNEHVQRYIDVVCAHMQDTDSPGHHIAVAFLDTVLQAEAHHRASPEMMQAIQQAAESPDRRAFMGNGEIIVGKFEQEGVTVFVSEALANIRRSARNDLAHRLLGFLAIAGVAAGVVNVVLLRLVTAPLSRLVDTVRAIANGKLESRPEVFASTEMQFLADEIDEMSQALAAADEYRAMQMAKAREIQRHVLPDHESTPGLSMASLFLPADEVGGDYYDIVSLSDGTVLLCVADVTGHGVSAAMATVVLRSLLHAASETLCHPAEILDFVNRRFAEAVLPGDFATAILVTIDLRTRRLTYVSAGHETAWLLSPTGERRELESSGLILGVDKEATWESHTFNVAPGERLLVVTDGVTENRAADGHLFGRERPVELLEECRDLSLDETVARMHETLTAFRQGEVQDDDVTLVLVAMKDEN